MQWAPPPPGPVRTVPAQLLLLLAAHVRPEAQRPTASGWRTRCTRPRGHSHRRDHAKARRLRRGSWAAPSRGAPRAGDRPKQVFKMMAWPRGQRRRLGVAASAGPADLWAAPAAGSSSRESSRPARWQGVSRTGAGGAGEARASCGRAGERLCVGPGAAAADVAGEGPHPPHCRRCCCASHAKPCARTHASTHTRTAQWRLHAESSTARCAARCCSRPEAGESPCEDRLARSEALRGVPALRRPSRSWGGALRLLSQRRARAGDLQQEEKRKLLTVSGLLLRPLPKQGERERAPPHITSCTACGPCDLVCGVAWQRGGAPPCHIRTHTPPHAASHTRTLPDAPSLTHAPQATPRTVHRARAPWHECARPPAAVLSLTAAPHA